VDEKLLDLRDASPGTAPSRALNHDSKSNWSTVWVLIEPDAATKAQLAEMTSIIKNASLVLALHFNYRQILPMSWRPCNAAEARITSSEVSMVRALRSVSPCARFASLQPQETNGNNMWGRRISPHLLTGRQVGLGRLSFGCAQRVARIRSHSICEKAVLIIQRPREAISEEI